MITTPIVKARGLFAPTLCFCNELKAIMAIVVREMAVKLSAATMAITNKPVIMVVEPAIAIIMNTIANSAKKTTNARRSEAFR